ncbi:MAG: 1-acyl-sn-glycerol-3-phosphate acyltransferase [Phycisphaerae bacterium]|nr:1-acyl-sn-glycerol-3-phosphate acyltransferase [Phycisphaerae bacterium]
MTMPNHAPDKTAAPRRLHPLAPLRATVRFVTLLVWTALCRLVALLVTPLAWFARDRLAPARKRISRAWMQGVRRLMGNRITVAHGAPPKHPFFLVLNHMSWIDFFVVYDLVDAVGIVEAPVAELPLVGGLMRGFNPIFVRRVKEDTARVNDLIVEAIHAGRSIVLAPETPETTIPRGTGVRMFRGGLLRSAIRTAKPVDYMAVTYRTPEGYAPAVEALTFGPNPLLLGPDGKIPQREIEMWGPPRSFLWHFLGVLALPWHEVIVTFGDEPVPAGDDRIALANRLHDEVEARFTPIA